MLNDTPKGRSNFHVTFSIVFDISGFWEDDMVEQPDGGIFLLAWDLNSSWIWTTENKYKDSHQHGWSLTSSKKIITKGLFERTEQNRYTLFPIVRVKLLYAGCSREDWTPSCSSKLKNLQSGLISIMTIHCQ